MYSSLNEGPSALSGTEITDPVERAIVCFIHFIMNLMTVTSNSSSTECGIICHKNKHM
jgi:hypothetical protein